MIVWGVSLKNIGRKNIHGNCPLCNSRDLYLVVMQKVLHIFWIPTLPTRKSKFVQCNQCGSQLPAEPFLMSMPTNETGIKTPWWNFLGLFIIIGLFIFGYFSEKSASLDKVAFQNAPTVGVYFTYDLETPSLKKTPYTCAKVEKVDGDKVTARISKYAYSKEKEARKAARDSMNNLQSPFGDETYEISRENFKALKVVSVLR